MEMPNPPTDRQADSERTRKYMDALVIPVLPAARKL
jgi:hypothetical protein